MPKKCPECDEETNYLCFTQGATATGTIDLDGDEDDLEYESDEYSDKETTCPNCGACIFLDDLEDYEEDEEDDEDRNENWENTNKPSGSKLIKLDIIK